jgi:hypothetical protein
MLDRVPYWLLLAALFVPGPVLIASFLGAPPVVIAMAPLGGALAGLVAAYAILRESKLTLSATWADVRAGREVRAQAAERKTGAG